MKKIESWETSYEVIAGTKFVSGRMMTKDQILGIA
jgi:hypothetical protein